MKFEDIIQTNYKSLSGNGKLWCRYAFHFTDISNAVEILANKTLYSRNVAKEMDVMHNDNASRQVINVTKSSILDYVRFYFRPLTPTQYHNEGFKHKDIRLNNANVPVPVFFVFDLNKLLNNPHTRFSEKSLAGSGCEAYSSAEEFSKLDFEKIYSDGVMADKEIRKYRQAEIIFPEKYNIDDSLVYIVCRNSLEKEYLTKTLYKKDKSTYEKYINRIYVSKRDNIFYYNGLFLDACSYHDKQLSIVFSDAYKRRKYALKCMQKHDIDKLSAVDEQIKLEWINNGHLLKRTVIESQVDYLNERYQNINLPDIEDAEYLNVKVSFENHVMCNIELPMKKKKVF